MIKESMVINVNNDLGNNVYYTIINKAQLNFKVNENERLETIQSKFVLKFMMKYLGIREDTILKTKLGKPYFAYNNIFFNYSHSNNYIACAISYYNVGIDIEETSRKVNNTIIKICNFTSENSLEEFVKREAYCKLVGKGLAMIFDKDNFKDIDEISKTIKTDEYICSICCECPKMLFKYIKIE